MQHSESLIGKWRPSTDGEKLFHFLAKNVAEFNGLNHLLHADFLGVMRGRDFARFTQGTIVLHCFGRIFQAAKWYRDENLDDPMRAVEKLNEFVIDVLGIARSTCVDFDNLAPFGIAAAKASSASSKTPNKAVKAEVLAACNNQFNCYSCGIVLDPSTRNEVIDPITNLPKVDPKTGKLLDNPNYLDLEHLWPHSFGGNSVSENLLPACIFCNREKKNIVSWEWAHVQAALPKFQQGAIYLEGVEATKNLKIGLHIRAAIAYAVKNGTTLKDAYGFVGPRTKEIFMIDQNDTPDFFNLRVHDSQQTGIHWG